MKPCNKIPIIVFLFLLASTSLTVSADQTEGGNILFSAEKATISNTLAGFTRARARMKLASQLTDRLVVVNSDIGEKIDNDGVFASLDSTMAELDLEQIIIKKKQLASRIAYLEKEVQRFRTLFEKQSAAEAKLDSLRQELEQAGLALRALENEEKKIQEQISRHTITAPAGWQVISRHAEPGEWVVAATPLAEVGDFSSLIVPFAVSQKEYTWIKNNAQNLSLWLPERNTSVKAKIYHFSPGFDPQTRKLNLELIITSELSEKRGGIRAELKTDLPDPSGALLVPTSAVSRRYDASWLTRANGKKVPVIVLGKGAQPDTVRIHADNISTEDRFILSPGSTTTGE